MFIISNLLLTTFFLSWKMYLLGGSLFGLYLWHRRKGGLTSARSAIQLRRLAGAACRLGCVLTAFAFLIFSPKQWPYLLSSFVAGWVLGWVLTDHLSTGMKALQQHGHIFTQPIKSRRSRAWWTLLAAAFVTAIVLIASKLGVMAFTVLAIAWAGSDGILLAWSLYMWSWAKSHERQGFGPLVIPIHKAD